MEAIKRKLLLLLISLSLGLTVSAQDVFTWDGLLTTMEHPTDPAQGSVLAIMTNDAYHPIKIKADEYAKVTDPLLLSGKPIQLDSIYHFVCKEEGNSYSYDFEQLHKGANYVTTEGGFVMEAMGPTKPGGEPLPGLYFYFLTKEGDKMECTEFTGHSEAVCALGGWSFMHLYHKSWEDKGVALDTLYTVRFLKLEEGYYRGHYIPTHLLDSRLANISRVEKSGNPLITLNENGIRVQSKSPIKRITLSNTNGYTMTYDIANIEDVVLPLSYCNQPSVIRIEYTDDSSPFTQKILLL